MKYRPLGKTNLNVSVIGIGTWQFGGEWGKDFHAGGSRRDVRRRPGAGAQPDRHRRVLRRPHCPKRLIGQAISRDRDKWIVATKFGHKFHRLHRAHRAAKPADVREQLEELAQGAADRLRRPVPVPLLGRRSVFDDDDVRTMLEREAGRGEGAAHRQLGRQNDNLKQIETATKTSSRRSRSSTTGSTARRRQRRVRFLHAAEPRRAGPRAAGERVSERQVQARASVPPGRCARRPRRAGSMRNFARSSRSAERSPARRGDGDSGRWRGA